MPQCIFYNKIKKNILFHLVKKQTIKTAKYALLNVVFSKLLTTCIIQNIKNIKKGQFDPILHLYKNTKIKEFAKNI